VPTIDYCTTNREKLKLWTSASSMFVLVGLSLQGSLAFSAELERAQFAEQLSKVQDGDKKGSIIKRLGRPDKVRRAPDSVPHPDDEIWCYGVASGESLATLGEVCFRGSRVVWVAGGWGEPPSIEVINEQELRAGMQFLHPGPEHAGYNDPLHLIRTTNYLQPLGKEKALAIIGEYARIHDVSVDETWLFLLLRTLFDVPVPPGHMPAMHIGAMSPSPPDEKSSVPRFPIIIVDDIPFSVLWGVTLAGSPQPVAQHVDYFREHGTIRESRLQPTDDPYPSFQKLLDSDEWKEAMRSENSKRRNSSYEGHTLLQVLALGRTAYDPPEARQPRAYPKVTDFNRHHKNYLELGSRWDSKLQMYVRKDGSHGEVGHLANIYK